jgi:sulfate transport system ATP-binding protein
VIRIEHLQKRFGSYCALDDVSLEVRQGELLALLGPSGSGKTTLLRVIAGLEAPEAGRVLFDGVDATRHSLQARQIGFVFQHYALFRHMSVFENVAFGLRVRRRADRPSGATIRARVMHLLQLVQLDAFADRRPSQLSGGQRQRVALARALAVEPRVLLLDEPFGALDAKVRKELRRWLRGLHEQLDITTVFVTHDQEEALELADRVVIMDHGRVEQVGTPDEVYARPATGFVYDFLGDVNLFRARSDGRSLRIGEATVEHPATPADGQEAAVYVRPHLVEVRREPHPAGLAARVVHVNATGPLARIELVTRAGDRVHAHLAHERYRALGLAPGAEVFVSFLAAEAFVVPVPVPESAAAPATP